MKIIIHLSVTALGLFLNGYDAYSQNTYNAGYASGTGGVANVHVGNYAGRISTGYNNVFVGYYAAYYNTTGYFDVFLGVNAGLSNSTGTYNTFVGTRAGYYNSTAHYNTFVGAYTGYTNSTGYSNSFLGHYAGYSNTSGYKNTVLGAQAGYYSTTSSDNSFIGFQAGYYNNGSSNTMVGSLAGKANTSGNNNSFLGASAGIGNTTGRENTFIGNSAGKNSTTGIANTALGFLAGSSTGTLSNATAIGHRAQVSAANSIVLGSIAGINGAANSVKVGIGVTAPAYTIHVNGSAAKPGGGSWTAASDKRLKQNIKDFQDGLAIVEKIRPVTFNYNGKAGLPTGKQFIGVVAQEMQQIAPYMLGKFTYQDTLGNQEEYLDYDATALTYILVNAVKEQQQQLAEKDEQIAQIKQELEQLKALILKNPTIIESQSKLWQNSPNPYNQTTTIKYMLAPHGNAFIKVYAANGQEMLSFDISGKTDGDITLSSGTLAAGTYVYSLFMDGKQADSKKLILIP